MTHWIHSIHEDKDTIQKKCVAHQTETQIEYKLKKKSFDSQKSIQKNEKQKNEKL